MEYWGVRKAGVVGCWLRVRRIGMVAAQAFVLLMNTRGSGNELHAQRSCLAPEVLESGLLVFGFVMD
jgi:hypothetical protein